VSAFADEMTAGLMPEGTICLTFDDGPGVTSGPGPGPRTAALAEYLASQRIVATFFMCGSQVTRHPDLPQTVLGLGHRIGNHTFYHSHLPSLETAEIHEEVRLSFDALVAAGAPTPMPFRPPYGAWDARCAAAVNADAELAAGHDGVYGWDIDGADWQSWELGVPDARGVADAYLDLALRNGAGVVLMHDSTAHEDEASQLMRAGNRTLEAITRLVPMLEREGFVFAPLPPA
jgi:peptidoglycan/xylan/chitin deacetylase (PgdA/CDA1 family)